MTTSLEIEQRVEAGVAFLDSKIPDWRDKIDTRWLNMQMGHYTPYDPCVERAQDDCGCVLAQLDAAQTQRFYGRYSLMRNELGLTEAEAEELGFSLNFSNDDEWAYLTKLWKEAIDNGDATD